MLYCSPKRYKKHVKQERDRTKSTSNVENPGHRRHQPADPTQARPSSGQMKAPGECFLTSYGYHFDEDGWNDCNIPC